MRMKKHFLLLLLMTLLPLAGWAQSAELAIKPSLAADLTYDGTDQALTTGSFGLPSDYDKTVGGVLWRVTTTADAPTTDESVAFAEVKAKNAGKYWVWYKVLADGDQYHDDGAWTQIGTTFVRINKASLGFEAATPAPAEDLVYDGTAKALFTANATAADFANIQYSIWDTTLETPAWSDWTDDVTTFKGTDAGSYSVKWQIANKADLLANLTDDESAYSGTFADVVIAGAEITAEFDGTPAFTFNGQEQTPTIIVKSGETTLTAGTDYEISYWTDEARTAQVEHPTDAKTYYIKVTGINNYRDNSVETLSYEIAKKSLAAEDVTAVVSDAEINKTYNGTAQKVSTGAVIVKAYVGTTGELTLVYGTDFTRENATLQNNTDVPAENATDEQKPRFKVVGKGNYTGERYVYFNIVPKPITDNDVTFNDDLVAPQPYTGSQITPSTENMITYNAQTLKKGEDKDFTVVYGENKVVAKNAEGTVINGGTITITGTGNYSGTVEKSFKITPAELTVNAKDFSKNLGTVDPTSAQLVDGNYYEITGFVGGENASTAGVTGAPTFAIEDHSETTGSHNVISISVGTLSAANYTFAASVTKANLIIGQAVATIAATATEKTYGYKLPNLVDNFGADALGFTATGMLAGADEIDKLTFTVTDAEGNEYAADAMLEAGEYTITPSAAHATTGSYVFTYTTAKLTIKPYIVKFVAVNQTIDYGDEPGLAKNGKWNNVSNTTWNNNRLEMWYGEDENNLTKATTDEFFTTYRLWKQDFVESLTWEVAANKPVSEPGTIKVNLKADYDSKNFTVTTDPGKVTYNDLGGLVLTSTDADLAAIEAADGTEVNVKIDFSLRNNRELAGKRYWKGGEWNTLTLPFDITVAELSQILGYAIVNEIDPNGYSESSGAPVYKFKLTMKGAYGEDYLPANKPFTIKTTDDIVGVKDFGTREIKAPRAEDLDGVNAGGGSMFKPAYAKKEVTKAANGNIWFLLGNHTKWAYITPSSENKWTILPFESYIDQNLNPASASNAIFIMEDLDGTTAIHGINVDDAENAKLNSAKGWYNLNGVKMENAPAMKGVYIKDGKKVVIK